VAILGEDDLELARSIHDDEMAATVTGTMEKFHQAAQQHRSAGGVFEVGAGRLMRALSRHTFQLDRDGDPTPRN
jgi:hypothetical protein